MASDVFGDERHRVRRDAVRLLRQLLYLESTGHMISTVHTASHPSPRPSSSMDSGTRTWGRVVGGCLDHPRPRHFLQGHRGVPRPAGRPQVRVRTSMDRLGLPRSTRPPPPFPHPGTLQLQWPNRVITTSHDSKRLLAVKRPRHFLERRASLKVPTPPTGWLV